MAMTDDEILMAMHAELSSLEDYRLQLESRYRGRVVHAYGTKTFKVTRVVVTPHPNGGISLYGPILKKDGSVNRGQNDYGVDFENADFCD